MLLSYFLWKAMHYVTFELLFISGQGLIVCFYYIKKFTNVKPFSQQKWNESASGWRKCKFISSVSLWLSGRALRYQCKRLWVQFPGNTHTDKKCIARMHCMSLWIKASAKCINVNSCVYSRRRCSHKLNVEYNAGEENSTQFRNNKKSNTYVSSFAD